MTNGLIIGAHGQIAQLVRQRLLTETDVHLTLYLRNSDRIKKTNPQRETIIDGDVNDYHQLTTAMKDQDIVYANLGGRFEPMAKNIVKAMTANNINRLIYVTGLGLYHEVPNPFGQWVEDSVGYDVMADTRRAAQIIEESKIDATIIRAAYMDNNDEIDYELTEKGIPFKGTVISRKSIADLIVKVIKNPKLYENSSLGIAKPGTNGDRPMF
ncbi:NAD(P)H-binding protein [Lentilactobacillus diolivorans]|uniref:NAD(P)H-binding protein n=1 Tax=Lentilactobacillus diolivorans TaxID=179838 RepID=UPI00246943C7|nr:NAD(P)H-binding protein [Lentilactobacillus diolivorans]MDH5105500.1 NAD(P)H-binding protein [Lentilactobacillus diolivorans]